MAGTAALSALGVAAPFVRGAYAAGKLSVGFWDHWVPNANGATEKLIRAWAEKEKVEIQPESNPDLTYVGKVLRRAAVFGARKLASDDPSQRSDERVVEVVVSADGAPLLVGQRVLVKFMKPGQKAGVKRDKPAAPVAGGMTKKKA